MMVTIVADAHIPFLRGALEPFCRMIYLPGNKIGREELQNAQGLIVRTRTLCNSALLEGTPVRFIASATIGFDHIDAAFCQSQGISWHHAAGCNAPAVAQYMTAALMQLAVTHGITYRGKTLGVVGVGHVGSRIARLGELLGMRVLLNDPPRAEKEGQEGFSSLEQLTEESDVITLHVPLTLAGPYKTLYLANSGFFGRLTKKPVFINTARGSVVESQALSDHLKKGTLKACALDVWEGEPHPDRELLHRVDIATPHIAGYSTEGKANGTAFCVQQASRFFGFGIDDWYPEALPVPQNPIITLDPAGKGIEAILHEAVRASYSILDDDTALRMYPAAFEELRNKYPVRREFPSYHIELASPHPEAKRILTGLGFKA